MSDGAELADAPLDVEEILGTTTYEGVLYTEQAARNVVPVDPQTGDLTKDVPSAEMAEAYAKDHSRSDRPYVATLSSRRDMRELDCAPIGKCVFCHFSIVGGLDRHETFMAAWDSPDFVVDVTPDYQTGNLTIDVSPA